LRTSPTNAKTSSSGRAMRTSRDLVSTPALRVVRRLQASV
jgi:hypothetical protein